MSQPPVDAGEALSRFLTQPKNHFAPTTGRLRYAAFLPNKALQTSVYRILGLTPDEVWSIGDVLVGAPLGKPIPARADIGAKAVCSASGSPLIRTEFLIPVTQTSWVGQNHARHRSSLRSSSPKRLSACSGRVAEQEEGTRTSGLAARRDALAELVPRHRIWVFGSLTKPGRFTFALLHFGGPGPRAGGARPRMLVLLVKLGWGYT
jgi:hypothetical protein